HFRRDARGLQSIRFIGQIGEHDRYRAGFPQQCDDRRRVARKQHFGFQIDAVLCYYAHPIDVARGPAIIGVKVASLHPPQFLKALPKSRKPGAPVQIGVSVAPSHQGANPSLRARRERPRSCPAEQRDERAAPHSITSSTSESRLSEILTPSAFAVFMLITSSNLTTCCTGKSAGFAPLRIFAA